VFSSNTLDGVFTVLRSTRDKIADTVGLLQDIRILLTRVKDDLIDIKQELRQLNEATSGRDRS